MHYIDGFVAAVPDANRDAYVRYAADLAAMAADPRTQPDLNPTPFDGKRLIYGGFQMVLDA
jgi:uncharacterized protein YbaA (DUF1428 family)